MTAAPLTLALTAGKSLVLSFLKALSSPARSAGRACQSWISKATWYFRQPAKRSGRPPYRPLLDPGDREVD